MMEKSRLEVYAEMLIDIDARLKAMEKGMTGKNAMRGKFPAINTSYQQKCLCMKRSMASHIITKYRFEELQDSLKEIGKQMNEIKETLKSLNI